ncbi:polyprenyl synthetase family protein [Spirochaetia bacterium 38H-sp]|uniref:Polyprenyl synthetase family protein n=1 Tax=Rarispira pelagica TaxID=3141764 RepID=A0ABU9U8C9_9SPIR
MFWKDIPELTYELNKVRSLIKKSVNVKSNRLTLPVMDFINRDAKMLRPGLLILSARIFLPEDKLPESVYRYAASIELLHMASLVHDDIIDNAEFRRGLVSINHGYGVKDAILVGDLLFCAAAELIYDSTSDSDASVILHGLKHLITAESEELDDAELFRKGQLLGLFGRRKYIRRVIRKTATLFVAAMHIGAREVCKDEFMQQTMRRIGYDIGVSFQMMDDILDIISKKELMGKSSLSDLREGVVGYPFVLAVNSGNKKDEDKAISLFRKALSGGLFSSAHRRALVDMLVPYCDLARNEVLSILNRAKKHFVFLPKNKWTVVLLDTIDSLANRLN